MFDVADRVWAVRDTVALIGSLEAPVARLGPYKKNAARPGEEDNSGLQLRMETQSED